MAAHNGYANLPGYGLYDTTGGTEDWTFWTAGSLSFTFEIGTIGFHPPYNNGVVDEYLGRGQTAGAPYDDWGNGRVDFESPRPRTETGIKEAWRMTCRRPDGKATTPLDVVVDRGGRFDASAACAAATARKG